MPHYLNPPLDLRIIGRLLDRASSYKGYAEQLKPDEHLFCMAYRSGHPQAAYIWDAEHFREYEDAVNHMGVIDCYYAMPADEWEKRFSYVPIRYEQKRIDHPEGMAPYESIFFVEDE